MRRNIIALCAMTALFMGACGASEEENKQDKETNGVENVKSDEETEEVKQEKASDPELLLKIEKMMEDLQVAVDDYCACMEKATSVEDCMREYGKLNFGLEEEDANKLSNDEKFAFLERGSEIIEASKACDKNDE